MTDNLFDKQEIEHQKVETRRGRLVERLRRKAVGHGWMRVEQLEAAARWGRRRREESNRVGLEFTTGDSKCHTQRGSFVGCLNQGKAYKLLPFCLLWGVLRGD